jgi:hypothetical protein
MEGEYFSTVSKIKWMRLIDNILNVPFKENVSIHLH